jgi:integrase
VQLRKSATCSSRPAPYVKVIRLTSMAVAALKEHRLATAKLRLSEWMFSSRAGTTLSVHNVHNRSWKPLLERAGLPASTRMHDLRHTCTTLLLSRGVPVKVVSEMLGYGDVAITLSVHQSVLPDMQESAARVMEEVLS